nr:hypothetical protein [Pseudomonadota bacterium]
MAASTNLPVPIQLVGATAALIFCTAVVSAIGYGQAIAQNWSLFNEMPRTWDGFYSAIVTSVGFYSVLAVISAALFGVLLFAQRKTVVWVSLAYLAVLLLSLAWRVYALLPGGGFAGLRLMAPRVELRLGICMLYAIWLIGLAWAVLPNYSLKRTAAGWLR